MSYPLYIKDFISEPTFWFLSGFIMTILTVVALYFDFWYREPQSKEIAIQLNKDIYAAIRENLNLKVSTNFIGSILSREEYEKKYALGSQVISTKKDNAYRLKPGFERPKSSWVTPALKAFKSSESKKQGKVPYGVFPVQRLSLDESRKISVGSVELVKEIKNNGSKG